MADDVKPADAGSPMPSSVTIKLRSPLVSHGGPITSITVREPKARDMAQMKVSPSTYYVDGKFQINHDVMLGYLVLMTGQDRMTLEDLGSADFNALSSVSRDYLNQMGDVPSY